MDEATLQAKLRSAIESATGGLDTADATNREKALDYYQGKKFGNEVDGESKFVSTDVHDTVLTILPDLVGPFVTSDDAVGYEPIGEEDIENAGQATAYVNFKLRNIIFLLLHDWFKDALLQRNGYVKAWYDDTPRKVTERWKGLDEREFNDLVLKDDFEVKEYTARPDPNAPMMPVMSMTPMGPMPMMPPVTMLHDVVGERTSIDGITAMNIPPEEFFIDRRARSIKLATICGHMTVKTESELIEMGYDKAVLKDIPSYDDLNTSTTRTARDDDVGDIGTQGDETGPNRSIAYYESYYRVDYDGDGIAELRQICSAGPAKTILHNEEWDSDRAPIFDLTPDRIPHRFVGMSLAEILFDIQIIKSEITRQWLNNIYQVNNARTAGNTNVDQDSLLNKRIGGHVFIAGQNDPRASLMELTTPSIAAHIAPMVEHLDRVSEERTGVSKNAQAIASDALHETAGGLELLTGRLDNRVQMIARIFSEMGVKPFYGYLLELATKHQDKEEIIRLRGKFVPMNPSTWNPKMDVRVNIGLGHGTKEQQIFATQSILGLQEKLMVSLGASNPLVTLTHVRNAAAKNIEAIGFPMVDKFIADPTEEEIAQFIQQKSQAQPNPLAEAEMVKAQGEMAKEQMKVEAANQQAAAKLALESEVKQAEHQRELLEIVLKDQRERMAMGLEWDEAEAERAMKVSVELAKHYQVSAKTIADHEVKMAGVAMQKYSVDNAPEPRPAGSA
jgi:hypothetical protein